MARPSVDVVVPFRGGRGELEALRERLGRLRVRPEDSVLVVDNTPGGESASGDVPVLHAAELRTPAFARNRGTARGSAEWLVFIDSDVVPSEDLLDRYFEPPPGERTALLAGGVKDEAVPPEGPAVARYAYLRGAMSQEDSFRLGEWAYAKTANVACRRAAFEEVGGFREDIRAAEDADLTYRLQAAGWQVERREEAAVLHLHRRTLRAYVAQKAMHGSGGAWLDGEYPGSVLRRRSPGLVWWAVRRTTKGLVSAARSRRRDDFIWAVFEPLEHLAWQAGRYLPNTRPMLKRGR